MIASCNDCDKCNNIAQSVNYEELLIMSEVEWEHEQYFRNKVLSHAWYRFSLCGMKYPPKKLFA
jgi:hypothetical protein